MTLNITTKIDKVDPDTLIVGVDGSGRVPVDAEDLVEYYAHLVKPEDKDAPFTGKWGQILSVPMPVQSNYARVLLVGLKNEKKTKLADWPVLGGKIVAALNAAGARSALIPAHDKKSVLMGEHLALLAQGMILAAYRFDKHKAPKKDGSKNKLATIALDIGRDKKTESLITEQINLAAGVILTRDVGNEPPNYLYPESFAKIIEKELKPLGVKVEIFDEKDLQKHKMGGILGVGMGSARPPRLVIMSWMGGKKGAKPTALIGKGVTFDTGGIDIKPSAGMEDMKFDMCGAGAVVGTMKALALNKAKVNVIGAVGLAENMPSHNAYRPADVLVSHAGKTVEVLNTDAEGRLVLMDVLSYIQKTYDPAEMIDLATLTGAIVVALGNTFTGAFVNNDKLWARIHKHGEETGERMWRMPLDEAYRKAMEGSITDLQNLSNWDRAGGSCTAAGFLEHFVDDGRPWAHLDIAGTAYGRAGSLGPKGSHGYAVRTLYNLLTKA